MAEDPKPKAPPPAATTASGAKPQKKKAPASKAPSPASRPPAAPPPATTGSTKVPSAQTGSVKAPEAPKPAEEVAPEAAAEELIRAAEEVEEDGKKKPLPMPTAGMSRKDLATQYEPYVRSISGTIWKTLSKDIEFEDLVGYGMLGLFEAYDRFDAKFGASFMTFSYYRIRGAIYDGLRGMGWVSRSEYAKFRTEARANAYLQSQHDREMAPVGGEANRKTPGSEEQAVEELADVVSNLVTIYVTALDAMEGFQIKDERGPGIDESLELLQDREIVKNAVEKLPEQERQLIQLYYYKEMSLEEVGKQLGLSKSWTSRLHTRAIDKLTRVLKNLVDEHWTEGQESGTKKTAQRTGGGQR